MLFNKLLILLYLFSSELHAACQESPLQRLSCRNEFYQNLPIRDSGLSHIEKESFRKLEALQQSKEFQDIVLGLQKPQSPLLEDSKEKKCPIANDFCDQTSPSLTKTEMKSEEASLYIFVSFSLGEKALLNLAQEAKQFGAILVLRGFREGSYRKTALALQQIIKKTGQGVIVDPELFSLFHITAVPTFVLTTPFQLHSQERIQTPIFDKLQGHVSTLYALESFVKAGDLAKRAKKLLHKGDKP